MAEENAQHSEDGVAPGYRIGTRTHVGLVRRRNEDYLQVRDTRTGLLVVVCDGMGGHAGGERASRLAVETFVRIMEEKEGDAVTLLRDGVTEANHAVMAESLANSEYAGMGTTLVAAILHEGLAKVANVGDSRAYLFRNGGLSRISRDHSLVSEMVARGEITEREASVHPHRNIITRALGSAREVEPDIFNVTLRSGDQLLLASDGLHGMISDAVIRDTLAMYSDPGQACDKLVDLALTAGGNDNVSVALVRVGEDSAPVDSPTDPGTISGKGTKGGTRGGIIAGMFILLTLAALWFFWLQPGEEERGPGNDSATQAIQVDGYVDDPFLGADSSALFDSAAADGPAAIPRDTILPGDTAVGKDDTLRPGDMISW